MDLSLRHQLRQTSQSSPQEALFFTVRAVAKKIAFCILQLSTSLLTNMLLILVTRGHGTRFLVVTALFVLTAMMASRPGRMFCVVSAAEEECTLGNDGACIASDGVDDVLATMKVETGEDGELLYETGFGVTQSLVGDQVEDTKKRLVETVRYMKDRVLMASANDVLSQVAKECQLRHEHCAFWAVIGECEKNPGTFVWFID